MKNTEKENWQTEEDRIFFSAPEWAKKKALKYILLIKATKGLRGKELKEFIEKWNEGSKEARTSYQSLLRARRTFYSQGKTALLAKYGKHKGKTVVKDEHFEMFKELYLSVLKPSMKSCAKEVKIHFGIKANQNFPSPISFLRRLKREMTQKEINYHRS